MTHVTTAEMFTPDNLQELFSLTDEFKQAKWQWKHRSAVRRMKGKKLVPLFYEPSTRTRISFESAMLTLGGKIIDGNINHSSVIKGESLKDTVRVVSGLCDVIVLRGDAQSIYDAIKVSEVPVINAGNGGQEHPTQALQDVYTIKEKFGRLGGLNLVVAGDLLNGRTVHSLLQILQKYPDNKVCCVSPTKLGLPKEVSDRLSGRIKFTVKNELEDALRSEVDVVYMTRLQKERGSSGGVITLTERCLEIMPQSAIVMHPLPRNGEIPESLDSDERMWYFKQAKNGLHVRMALLVWMKI